MFHRSEHPDDYKLLRKPLIVKTVGRTTYPTKLAEMLEGRLDGDSHTVLDKVVLRANNLTGREYRIVDLPDDGFFPGDADGLVDKVSKRDIHPPAGWSGRKSKYDRTPWKAVSFEQELYEILTEKYNKVAQQGLEPGMVIK